MQSLPTRIPLESLSNILQKVLVKAMFATFAIFEILLFEGKSLSPFQRGTGSEKINIKEIKHKLKQVKFLKWPLSQLVGHIPRLKWEMVFN